MRIKLGGSKQLSNSLKGCGSMIYVGIDIAKEKHFAAAMTADGEVLIQPFGFNNNSVGFKLLLSNLKSFDKSNIEVSWMNYNIKIAKWMII